MEIKGPRRPRASTVGQVLIKSSVFPGTTLLGNAESLRAASARR